MSDLEALRLDAKCKQQLITLKRRTGIPNWNVLCRWALCTSLATETNPPEYRPQKTDGGVEIATRTLFGNNTDLYLALLKQDSVNRGMVNLVKDVRAHLHAHVARGLGYLAAQSGAKDIESLVRVVSSRSIARQ